MHRTSPHWEAGGLPGPELVARVGEMLGAWAASGLLLAGEGLRPSSQGVRLRFADGRRWAAPGPFAGENELPAAFAILRVETLDDAVEWASRYARLAGDVEIDVRPVTEPWDLGLADRPEALRTRRFMAMLKADAASEAGTLPPPARRAEIGRLLAEARRSGVLLAAEALEPSARGVRLRSRRGEQAVLDGPFAESKELVAGYVILRVASMAEALPLARRYADVVACPELDVRPLVEPERLLP